MREFQPPEGSSDKMLFYVLSGVGWLGFVLFLLAVGTTSYDAWVRFCFLIFAIACAVAGSKFYKAGGEADAKEAKNTAAIAETRANEVKAKQSEIQQRNLEIEAVLGAELRQVERQTQAKRLQTEQVRLELEQALMEVGRQQGLRPEDVSEVNKHKYLKDIDLAVRWKEIEQDFDAGDLYSMAEQQLVHKMTAQFEQWVRARHAILVGSDPPEVKNSMLARYDKNIRYLEAKLDAQQAGLLLSENGQEARRLTTGTADSGSHSSEEI